MEELSRFMVFGRFEGGLQSMGVGMVSELCENAVMGVGIVQRVAQIILTAFFG